MTRRRWTERMQEMVLGAICTGRMGKDPSVCDPSLFYDERRDVAQAVRQFRDQHGLWPDRSILSELGDLQPECARSVASLPLSALELGAEKGRELLAREALKLFGADLEDILEESPENWPQLRRMLDRAITHGQPRKEPYDYLQDIEDRARDEVEGHFSIATGMSDIDVAMRGGISPGEVGLLLGPTKRGKSFVATHLGGYAIDQGFPVLNISLELTAPKLAARYDRYFSGMTQKECRDAPKLLRAKVEERLPDPSMLRLLCFPRNSLSVSGVEDEVEEALDVWGRPGLVIVDYASILRKEGDGAPHEQIQHCVEKLSSMAMHHGVPCWTPFQGNRGSINSGERMNEAHAAGSYDATHHVDVILYLNQTPAQKLKRQMTIDMGTVRDYEPVSQEIRTDWARSTLHDWDETPEAKEESA